MSKGYKSPVLKIVPSNSSFKDNLLENFEEAEEMQSVLENGNSNEYRTAVLSVNEDCSGNEDVRDDVPFLLDDTYSSRRRACVDHCHSSKPVTSTIKEARRKLIIGSCLCVTFMLAEFIGGCLSNSLAIMTDAAHLLSDLTSFLISLFAIWLAQKEPTKKMSFGFHRAEILGAVASTMIIWVLTGILVYLAIDRIRFPDYKIEADTMIIVSGLGVVINILMGIVLHSSGTEFGHHGHSHQTANNNESPKQNINVRAAFIHVLGDLIQSIGVLIAAYIIRYFPEYKIADPICTFLFSALVLFTTLAIMRDALWVLMEGFPKDLSYPNIINALKTIDGVITVHSLHVWSLTLDRNSLAVHLAINENVDPDKVLGQAQTLMRKQFGIYQATIQVEKYQAEAMSSCETCQGPNC